MLANLTETVFSPTTLLWLAVSLFAVMLLFSSMSQQRRGLVETLRSFVRRELPPDPNADNAVSDDEATSAGN